MALSPFIIPCLLASVMRLHFRQPFTKVGAKHAERLGHDVQQAGSLPYVKGRRLEARTTSRGRGHGIAGNLANRPWREWLLQMFACRRNRGHVRLADLAAQAGATMAGALARTARLNFNRSVYNTHENSPRLD